MIDHDSGFEFVDAAPPQVNAAGPTSGGLALADLAKYLDLRTVLKPPLLGPRDEDFTEWRYEFQNTLTPLAIDDLLEAAVAADHEVEWTEMNDRNKLIARFIHMLLVPCVRQNNKAANLVRAVLDKNGWVTWRRLCQEFQPRDSDRWTAVEIGLMQPRWTSHRFIDQFYEWKNDLARYELESGRRMPDHTKVSIVARWAPPEIRYFLRTAPASITASFHALDAALVNFIRRGVTYNMIGIPEDFRAYPQPMDLGNVDSGRWVPRAMRGAARQEGSNRQQQRWHMPSRASPFHSGGGGIAEAKGKGKGGGRGWQKGQRSYGKGASGWRPDPWPAAQ